MAKFNYKNTIKELIKDKNYCPFRREQLMEFMFTFLKKDFDQLNPNKILDAAGGYGRITWFLNEMAPQCEYTVFDYVEALVKEGREKFSSFNNVRFEVEDLCNPSSSYKNQFDITISNKVISWLDSYEEMVRGLFYYSKQKIYITSLFWDGDIDFYTTIHEKASSNSPKVSKLNTYSFPKFKLFCESLGAKSILKHRFNLDLTLSEPKTSDILETYTKSTSTGNIEILGTIIQNYYVIEISL